MRTRKNVRLGEESIYSLKQISKTQAIILGLQHTFAMFGATVLVPLITGLQISTALLMAGLGTLLFHLITGGQIPIFLGSSFAFLGGYAAVAPMVDGKVDPAALGRAGGGIIVAGAVYLVLAILIKFLGVKRVMRFFPPIVTGPIIISIGLILSPSAISNASQNWLLALVAIGIVIVCNIWGKGMIKIIPIILGLVGAYVVALLTNAVDFSSVKQVIAEGRYVEFPVYKEYFATFDLSAILTMAPIALATIMEHIGDVSAVSATCERNYISNPGLHRTLIGDGVATMFSAFFGGPANTTYGENTGVLALTKIYAPGVMRIAAVFAIFLSMFPVFSQVINTVPVAIIGGVSLILYGTISAVGVRNLVENQVDLTKSRNLIIAAVILTSALGFNAIGGITITVAGTAVNLSGLAIASLVGILLNAVLPGKDYVFEEEDPTPTGVNFSTADTSKEGKYAARKAELASKKEQLLDKKEELEELEEDIKRREESLAKLRIEVHAERDRIAAEKAKKEQKTE